MLGLPGVMERGSQKPSLSELLNTVHRLLQLRRSDQLVAEELRTRYTPSLPLAECLSSPAPVSREARAMSSCRQR